MLSQIQLTPGMDQSTMAGAINQNFEQLATENRTKTIRDETGIDRIIIGRYLDGTYGLKVSKEGVDVNTASDKDLILNSANNLFKIVRSGTVTLASPNAAGQSRNVSITHDVGTNPIIFAYASLTPTGTAFPLPYLQPELVAPTPGLINYQVGYEAVNNDTITFYWRDIARANNLTAYIRYYIVQETASYS